MKETGLNFRPALPNALTMTALAFGVSSLNMAFWGQWKMAVLFIILSALFDFFDGKVARMLGVSSKFGAELDSLSDFVSFGVAPGFLMYQWTMDPSMRIDVLKNLAIRSEAVGVYWIFVLFLAMCCAARLARFNTMLDKKLPPYWTHFFMGVPAPAGAFLAILPMILWFAGGESCSLFKNPVIVGFFLVFSGVMMASKVPTICLKHIHLNNRHRTIAMILFLIFIAILVTTPFIALGIAGLSYLVSIPIGVWYFIRQRGAYFKKK